MTQVRLLVSQSSLGHRSASQRIVVPREVRQYCIHLILLAAFVFTFAATSWSQTFLTVSPSFATVAPSATQQFTASQSVTWSVNGVVGGNATVGTISTSGLYTAPATPIANVIIAAVYNSSIEALANVSVVPTAATSALGWGANGYDQLGNGTTTNSSLRVPVTNSSGFIQVAGGAYFSVALKSDGTVWTWGDNGEGELGNGTYTSSGSPVQVSGLTGIVAVAASYYDGFALKNDGSIWGWGYNVYGEIGNGNTTTTNTPVQSGLVNAVAVVSQGYTTYGLRNDGTVWAWGFGGDGELGNGTTTTTSPSPVQVSGISSIVSIVAGGAHGLALQNNGTLWAWGYNAYGQLGNGSNTDSPSPVQVSGLPASPPPMILGAGSYQSLAVLADGTLWGWGGNFSGQLGNGTTNSALSAIELTGINGVIAISGGYGNTVVEKNDGTVWTWGYNGNGELDNGTTIDSYVPVQALGASGVVSVASGQHHVLAVTTNSALFPAHFVITATTASPFSGAPIGITVAAVDSNNATLTSYTGIVHFTSSDPLAVLPADYTFNSTDAGVHTFTDVSFSTVGRQTITVADIGAPASASTSSLSVTSSISITPAVAQVAAGATQQFTASLASNPAATFAYSVNGVVGGNATFGTISTTGLYTAPAAPVTVTISATSAAAPSTVGLANVTVTLVTPSSAAALAWGCSRLISLRTFEVLRPW